MSIVINQPAGLGDILFCQKIAALFKLRGNDVVWPVIPHYSFIAEYLKEFYFPTKYELNPEDTLIDIESASILINGNVGVMESKYELVGENFSDWYKYVKISRNQGREKKLFDKYVREEPYIFMCDTFVSPPRQQRIEIDIRSGLPIVKMNFDLSENPFDWCMVIERAEEIHMVDTCFAYITEVIDCISKRYCMYPRLPYFKTLQTKNIMTSKKWEFMDIID